MKKGMISFKAEGGDYALRLGIGALDEYEEKFQENSLLALEALEQPHKDPKQYITRLVNLFMVAIRPRLEDRDAARDLLDEIGIARVSDLLTEAATKAFADSPEAKSEPKKKSEPEAPEK